MPEPACAFCHNPLPCQPIRSAPATGPGAATADPPIRTLVPSGVGTSFEADVELLSRDDGGRHTPVFDGYRPQLVLPDHPPRTATLTLLPPTRLLVPGDRATCSFELAEPTALSAGQTFELHEREQVVGRGVVNGLI